MELGARSARRRASCVFPLLEPQRGAPDEAALDLLGIARILQAQPLERGLDVLAPPREQLVQQVGHAAAVDAADAAVDEAVEVAQDQPLRSRSSNRSAVIRASGPEMPSRLCRKAAARKARP
jgi:hypothetical protein